MTEDSLKQKTKKGIYWTFFNQFANNGLSFLVGIIMARLLSPSDYGITALPSIFIAIASVLVGSGFGNALVRKVEIDDKDLSTAFYYSVCVGFFCYITLYFFSPYIATFFGEPELIPLVRITALTFLWSPLATPQNVILQRRLDFKTQAKISIVNNTCGATIGICLAYSGYGLWSLVAMGVCSSILNTFQYWYYVRWTPKEHFSKASFHYLWNYGNKMMLSALIDRAYNNITPIFIGKFFSPQDLGIYNRAAGYAALPAQQGSSVIQSVTFPVLSKMQNDDVALAKNYRKMMRVTAYIIFPVMLFLSALARPVVILLVTDKWESCILLLQIMCFSMMWYPIHAMNLNLLMVKGRSDLFLRLEIIKKIVGLTIMALTLPLGIIYFVSAGIVSSMISLFINTYYTGKLIHVTYWVQMKDLLPIFGLSFSSWLSIIAVNCFVPTLWMQLICGIVVGFVVYLAGTFIFRFDEIKEVKYMLNKKS